MSEISIFAISKGNEDWFENWVVPEIRCQYAVNDWSQWKPRVLFPWDPSETLPKTPGTLRVEGKQNSLFPMEQVIKCFSYTFQLKNRTNCRKLLIYLVSTGTHWLQFQDAWNDHVRVESPSCCFPRELVTCDSWHVTCPLILTQI